MLTLTVGKPMVFQLGKMKTASEYIEQKF